MNEVYERVVRPTMKLVETVQVVADKSDFKSAEVERALSEFTASPGPGSPVTDAESENSAASLAVCSTT